MKIKPNRCTVCGKRIRPAYTRCWDCHRRDLGKPKQCKLCGAIIDEKYIYCWSCAVNKKLIQAEQKDGDY